MIKLYLVRHGETAANQSGVYYGRHDVAITENGIEQCRRLAEILKNVPFDRVITSGLLRSRQSAQIIRPEMAAEAISAFDELDFGDWEGRHYRELIEQDNERYAAWCNDWIHQAPPGGESFSDFQQRINAGLEDIVSQQQQGSLLLVGHQGTLRVITLLLLNMPASAFWHFTFAHGAYSLIELEQGHAVIQKINAG
jgi:alpha-ribazole phosphatase